MNHSEQKREDDRQDERQDLRFSARPSPTEATISWGEKFVTWQAFGIVMSIVAIGLGWALVSVQQVDARSQKRDDDMQAQIVQYRNFQQSLNDLVIRIEANQDNMQKTLDKIALKLNVN